jgi:hypothetical protein
MAEQQRKFGALATLRQRAENEAADMSSSPAPVPAAERRQGRAPGKRSNPEWKLYSHFLKKRTQREAMAILRAEDTGRDLSDVLQELLQNWIDAQVESRKGTNSHI